MNFISKYTLIILFIGLLYLAIKDYRGRSYINGNVRKAYIALIVSTTAICAGLIGYLFKMIDIGNIFGTFILINLALLIYIIYQHYIYEEDCSKKKEYKKNMINMIIVFIIFLLLVLYKI